MTAATQVQPASDAPIRLGTMLFTLVEPHPGRAREYNRWYERDHFYAGCLTGAYCFAGRRFVATRDLKALGYPDPGAPGSYLALYWVLAGHVEEWNRWAVDQVNLLHRSGRMFADRDHVHTLLYDYAGGVGRDAAGVPAELALDHPFQGVVAVLGRAAGSRPAFLNRTQAELPARLAGSPVALCLSFTPRPLLADAPADVPRSAAADDEFLQLYFTDVHPAEAWDWFRALPDGLAGASVDRVAAFRPTVPGTDRFVDEI